VDDKDKGMMRGTPLAFGGDGFGTEAGRRVRTEESVPSSGGLSKTFVTIAMRKQVGGDPRNEVAERQTLTGEVLGESKMVNGLKKLEWRNHRDQTLKNCALGDRETIEKVTRGRA